jgi:Protein of unknown function (DUF5818)
MPRKAKSVFWFALVLSLFPTMLAAQTITIQEIPPAMNLLSQIPIAQVGETGPANHSPAKEVAQNQQTNAPSSPVETFTGTIVKRRDGYYLKGPGVDSYRLDDGKKAAPFKGQAVEITGRLEPDTNLIRIGSIKPAH